MPDFFISYTAADSKWAEWISWTLEVNRYSVMVQAWDFIPGSNFVLEMQRASAQAPRTIAVLSPDYLQSSFAKPEWAASFAQDPEGIKRSLIPVVVSNCSADGLLKALVHINLVGLNEEDAELCLLSGLLGKRAKPNQAPIFPGIQPRDDIKSSKPFPGNRSNNKIASPPPNRPSIPKILGTVSDLDRARYIKQSFETIRAYFESGIVELRSHPSIDAEFNLDSASKFTIAVFINGKRQAYCKIWLGGIMGSDQISYYEGGYGNDNAFNEALVLANNKHELALSAMMKTGFGVAESNKKMDFNNLSSEEAAEYLWQRFITQLN